MNKDRAIKKRILKAYVAYCDSNDIIIIYSLIILLCNLTHTIAKRYSVSFFFWEEKYFKKNIKILKFVEGKIIIA